MLHGWHTLVGQNWYGSLFLVFQKNQYASFCLCLVSFLLYLMLYISSMRKITEIADEIGVGVHFNPFVTWNEKVGTFDT